MLHFIVLPPKIYLIIITGSTVEKDIKRPTFYHNMARVGRGKIGSKGKTGTEKADSYENPPFL